MSLGQRVEHGAERPKRILLPLLGEMTRLANGCYQLRPIVPDLDGETWLAVKDAAKLLKWRAKDVYPFLGDLLVFERPLKRRIVVSLRSVMKLRAALRCVSFWEDQARQTKLREWVFSQMAERRNV